MAYFYIKSVYACKSIEIANFSAGPTSHTLILIIRLAIAGPALIERCTVGLFRVATFHIEKM